MVLMDEYTSVTRLPRSFSMIGLIVPKQEATAGMPARKAHAWGGVVHSLRMVVVV